MMVTMSSEAKLRDLISKLRDMGVEISKVEETEGSDGYHSYRVVVLHLKASDELAMRAVEAARREGLKVILSRRSKRKPPRLSLFF